MLTLTTLPLQGPTAPGPISGPEIVTNTSKNEPTEKFWVSSFVDWVLFAVTPPGVVKSPAAVPEIGVTAPKTPSVLGPKTFADTLGEPGGKLTPRLISISPPGPAIKPLVSARTRRLTIRPVPG